MTGYLPVGSVIRVDDTKLIILGNTTAPEDGKLTDFYLVAKYPLGYMGSKSVSAIKVDDDYKVEFEGYSFAEADKYLAAKRKFNNSLKTISVEDARKVVENLNALVKGGKSDE
ncbi:MAG: DUF4176 domain-containing protein [Clostridia bacterium]|nr:DUF4176 domain-containing protein [Clostridia bacterium]